MAGWAVNPHSLLVWVTGGWIDFELAGGRLSGKSSTFGQLARLGSWFIANSEFVFVDRFFIPPGPKAQFQVFPGLLPNFAQRRRPGA